MSRRNRIALLAAATLLVAVSGTVFATRQEPRAEQPAHVTQDGEDAPPSAEKVASVAERLGVDAQVIADLAAQHGLGGAVRLVSWSAASGKTIEEIAAMRGDGTEGSGMGWGQIAKDLGVHPGIGSIMGGGQGRANAPGQQDRGTDEDGSGD